MNGAGAILLLSLTIGVGGLIGSVLILLVIRASTNSNIKSWQPWTFSVLGGYALAYISGLAWVSLFPIWKTGDVEVWAEFPENLAWAVVLMAYAQFVCVPLAVSGYALYRRLRRPA